MFALSSQYLDQLYFFNIVVYSKTKQNKTHLNCLRNHIVEIQDGLKGYYTLNQKLTCFVLYLKIINTFLKTNICIL